MSGDISLEGARSFFADCSKPQDLQVRGQGGGCTGTPTGEAPVAKIVMYVGRTWGGVVAAAGNKVDSRLPFRHYLTQTRISVALALLTSSHRPCMQNSGWRNLPQLLARHQSYTAAMLAARVGSRPNFVAMRQDFEADQGSKPIVHFRTAFLATNIDSAASGAA